MELKPGYKLTEVGMIPQDWDETTTRAIASRNRNAIVGGPFGSDLVSRDYVEIGVPVIRGQNMGGMWISGNFVFVSTTKANDLEANLARSGDLVFTQRGTVGQVSLVPEFPYERYLVSQSQMKLTVNSTVADPTFYYYVYNSAVQQDYIKQNTIQTGVPHINLGILRQVPVQLPPLNEQHVIATVLSDIDALLSEQDKLIAKKRDIKQAAIQQLLNGRKRLQQFSPHEGRTRNSEFGVIPEDWKVIDISHLCTLQRGFDLTEATAVPGTIPVYSSSGISYYHSKAAVNPPGVVTGRKGILGRVFLVNEPFWPHDTTLWVKDFKNNSPEYVALVLQNFHLERLDAATSIPTLNRNNLAGHSVVVPGTRAEQDAIAAVLSDMDAEITALEHKRDKTRAIKQGMMQQLLTGKKRLVAAPATPEAAASGA